MSRAYFRREARKPDKKSARYTVTREQLDILIQDELKDTIAEIVKDARQEAVNEALSLLLTLPLEVLMEHYWTKSYEKRIPEFTQHLLDYYQKWQNGELDMDKMKEDLWKYAGVKLVNDFEEDTKNDLGTQG